MTTVKGANVRFVHNVDGIITKGKVNRIQYEDATYGYVFFNETPIEEGCSEYFGYIPLRNEFVDDVSALDVAIPEFVFPFDEADLPGDAWDCGPVTNAKYLT